MAFATRAQAVALFPAILTAPLLLGWRGLGRFRVLYGDGGGRRGRRGRRRGAPRPLAVRACSAPTRRRATSTTAPARWRSGRSGTWPGSTSTSASSRSPRSSSSASSGGGSTARSGRSWRERRCWPLWLWLEVSAFASIPTVQRIEERNLFYVAPFFLIALLLWIRLGAPRRLPWAVVVALGSRRARRRDPVRRASSGSPRPPTRFALLPWWKLQEHVITLHQVRPVATACALAAGVLFLVVPRRFALVLPLLVLVYFGAAQRPIESRTTLASRGALFQGIRGVRPDWIDRGGRPRRRRGGDLDGQAGRARDLGERVLQPQRRPDLRHGRRDPRRPALDRGDDRPAHRPRPGRRQARAPPLRPRRLLARAEREGGRLATRCSGSRSTGWTGRCGR